MFIRQNTYSKHEVTAWPIPNYWDWIGFLLVFTLLFLVIWGAKAMLGQYHIGEVIPISLRPVALPYYALRSVLRMFIALFCSLFFTFIFGTWAAKNRHAERVIIPMIDILQSVPVLGFLSITVVGFVVLFQGSLLGPECASIFAIFTAQVWNMVLSFYQSLKTLPLDLCETANMFRLSAWQRFWRIEVPFALPSLLWNIMLSMSASWVFLVASEAITVANQHITLPGVGSYISLAIHQKDMLAILFVVVAMLVVITLYDQLFFRPLIAWAEKFKIEESSGDTVPESWVLNVFQRARFFRFIASSFSLLSESIVNCRYFRRQTDRSHFFPSPRWAQIGLLCWNGMLILSVSLSLLFLLHFIFSFVSLREGFHVIYLGFMTALRVMVLLCISSILWLPVGVWIGLSSRASQIVQPMVQFLAAFPVNLLFPFVALLIVHHHLSPNIFLSPLMILGTQWYILFNVVAGTMALPKNLRQVTGTLNVQGWLWWKRLALPAVFPYYITGVITAAGGAWNISIVAEAVHWGSTHLVATGLGAYIAEVTQQGDFPKMALGILVMSLYVLGINRVLWKPLYRLAEERFQIR